MFSKAQKAVIQLVLGVALCSPAGAAQLDLINLHNYTGLYPNVLLSMDDSGSMSVNYLRASPLKPDLNLYQQAGVTLGPDWRELSGDFNVVYYNPRIEYTPWVGRPDADVAAALSALGGLSFTIWQDTSWLQPLPVGGHRYALGADGLIDYWDNHIAVHVTPAGVFDVRQITFQSVGGYVNPTTTSATLNDYTDRTVTQELQNIANWHVYHSRRHLAMKHVMSHLIARYPHFYYGLDFLNESEKFVPVRGEDVDPETHNQQLLELLYAVSPSGGTPLKKSMIRAGNYFREGITVEGKKFDSPITQSCQMNLNMVLTDGQNTINTGSYGDVDGDGFVNTMADIARYFYTTDLAPDLPNIVPSYNSACPSIPHMSHQSLTYLPISFGAAGKLVPDADLCWPEGINGIDDPAWGTQSTDDLWHAAYNSRGLYAMQTSPQGLFQSLDAMLGYLESEIVFGRNAAFSSFRLNAGH